MDTRQTKKTAEAASRSEDVLETTGTEVPQQTTSHVNEPRTSEWRALCKEFDENLNLAVNALAIGKKQSAPQLFLYFDKILPIINLWLGNHQNETPLEDHPLHHEFLKYATDVTPILKAKLLLLKNKGTPAEIIFTALDYRSYASIEQAQMDQRNLPQPLASSEASGSIRSALSNPMSSVSRNSTRSRRRATNHGRTNHRGRQNVNRAREYAAPYDYAEPEELLQELRRYRELPEPWNKIPVQSVRKERLDISRQVQLAGDRQFKGHIDDYFKWRDFFIGTIGDVRCYARHKVNALRRSLDSILDTVVDYVSADFEGYREIIANLEKTYGGTFRQMARYDDYFDASKFKYGNLEKFRDYSRKVAGYRALLVASGDRALFATPHIYRRLLLPLPNGHIRELQTWLHSGGLQPNASNLLHWTRDRLDRLLTEKEVDRPKERTNEKEKTKHEKTRVMVCQACPTFQDSEPEEYRSSSDKESEEETTCATLNYVSLKRPEFCMLACPENHPLSRCPIFLKADPEKRRALIGMWKVLTCYACLDYTHTSRNCRSKKACEVCSSKNHHTLLHLDVKKQVRGYYNPTIHLLYSKINLGKLPFLHVKISSVNCSSSSELPFHVNAVIDTGANVSVVSSRVRQRLRSGDTYSNMTLNTAAGPVQKKASIVKFKIWPLNETPLVLSALSFQSDELFTHMQAWDVQKLIRKHDYLRSVPFPLIEDFSVDLLIGNDFPGLTTPIKTLKGPMHTDPVAEFSMLGWSVRGPNLPTVTNVQALEVENQDMSSNKSWEDLLNKIERSWEIQERIEANYTSPMDKIANEILARTMKLQNNFISCGLLWKEGRAPVVVNNRALALRRLYALYSTLDKNKEVRKHYEENIQNWIEDGSLIEAAERPPEGRTYYLSHFPVVRLDKETTKVRTVVDASARYRGVCLNDHILPGPNLANDIRRVLLRFRYRPVAITGDIKSMFTRIKLLPEERSYHRILWSKDGQDIREFEFTSFTFGNTCSPAVAMSASKFLTGLFSDNYNRAKDAILHSTIVDDTLDSVDTPEDGILLIRQIQEIYGKGSMKLHKLGSNNKQILEAFPGEEISKEVSLSFESLSTVQLKTLGVKWSPVEDTMEFQVEFDQNAISRRQLLSNLAKIYDPLGLISPLLIQLKILIQKTWMTRMSWDGELPEAILNQWKKTSLAMSGRLIFERKLVAHPKSEIASSAVHIFSDASSEAYGAVAYIKVLYKSGTICSRIIMSSSRVAPVKFTSIPRLELQGAVEAVKLAEHITTALDIDPHTMFFWSDSTDVLHWLRSASRTLKVFVASRVAYIQGRTSIDKWNWVPTEENPADLLSRGVSSTVLQASSLWKDGPVFIRDESQLPIPRTNKMTPEAEKERKNKRLKITLVQLTITYWNAKLKRFHSWRRFLAAIVFILRKIEPTKELNQLCTQALYRAVALLQEELLEAIFRDLKNNKQLPTNHQYAKFRLFFHQETGAIHASGRLSHAIHLPFLTKFPLFIPEKTYLSTIIIRSIHEEDMRHMGGTKSLVTNVSATFAIPYLQSQVKRVVKSCVYCKRLMFRAECPTTAPMPSFRLPQQNRNELFETSAMDCLGPLMADIDGMKKLVKMYVLVITCTFYRAVHLELIDSLSSDSFLLAFERFIAVRQKPKTIISDNGRNFIGSWNLLEKIFANLPERLKNRYPSIKWKFNTPLDPHKGGIFERIVGLTKQNLSKLMRNQKVTREQLYTMVKLTEGALNNRPLISGQQDLNDEEILTPNHFIRGSIYNTISPNSKNLNAVQAWKRTNSLLDKFWRRFVNQFITDLNIHAKKKFKNIIYKKGQVVMVKEEPKASHHINFPMWPIGKITEVYPGEDNIIRTVKVLINNKEYLRGSTKICPLIEGEI